jgi:uncharacterized protein (DUF2062 family)
MAGPAWWRRRLLSPILEQMRRGISPEKLALTIAAGAALGVFPLPGTTMALCFVFAFALRLNQPVIHLTNYLVYPLQIPLIYLFVRFGEWLVGTPPVSFRVTDLMTAFSSDPLAFVQRFTVTGLHGIAGWFTAGIPLALALYFFLLPLLRRVENSRVPPAEVPTC